MVVDPNVYSGPPAEERHPNEMAVYAYLDKLGISYQRCDHDYANTMEDCKAVEQVLGAPICKNLLLTNRKQTDFYLLMMPGTKKFKTAVLSKQIQSARLSFAGPEYMEEFLDITPGSVSIMGLMNDKENHVQLLIDRDVLAHETIGCHPCINTSSLRLNRDDVLNKFLPAVHHDYIQVDLPWAE